MYYFKYWEKYKDEMQKDMVAFFYDNYLFWKRYYIISLNWVKEVMVENDIFGKEYWQIIKVREVYNL